NSALPEVGTEFLGFHLIEELGQGAFGKVFLARQGELANRPVALKVATNLIGESRTLAQLQHTNVVPIHSVHRSRPFQAVCMPFFGRTTLADLLRAIAADQGPPASGKGLVSTLRNRQSRTLRSAPGSSAGVLPAVSPSDALAREERAAANPSPADATLVKLEGMSYVEAILWVAARLADGLAHAHDRGILHRDLKPANVLLGDDGEPMLLDFNLSEDTKLRDTAARASIGGTLPYMAPEHLEAVGGGTRPVDARSDLYSFGVILYELLTGKPLHPRASGAVGSDLLGGMIAARLQPPPRLRPWNGAVSPATESIVRRCLDPDPDRRYQTAHELREDLQRQLDHLPLRHAPDPSAWERATKFRRRHPRLMSLTSLGLAAAAVLGTLLASVVALRGRLEAVNAAEAARRFQDDLVSARVLLNPRSDRTGEGRALARAALDRYQALDRPDWATLGPARPLPAADRQRLSEDVGEMLMLLATADRTREGLPEADRLLALAAGCFPPGGVPRALAERRAEVKESLADPDAGRLRAEAEAAPLADARGHVLAASREAERGRFQAALRLLDEARRLAPRDWNLHYLRG
ncbi:MAG: protein kinase domain-containing protein, partial [Gemmataceae bacterium]